MLRSSLFVDATLPRINREVDCKGAVIKASILKNYPVYQAESIGGSTLRPSPPQEGEGDLKIEPLRFEMQ